ncbi:MAG: imidazole glycerol phosphate synthase subunit HisH [Candidatus Bathyarchaeota archaeon]|nr:MAG: imidazole glycerol phosphate synthase subunit HisH [Candidatus Bathyarchaeota archaeon]
MKKVDRNLPKITIVDYGMGNLLSISKALEIAGSSVKITAHRQEIVSSDAIVLPGVGAFRDAISRLRPLSKTIVEEAETGKPILGVCLGLQLMFTESTEGGLHQGLNLCKGRVIKLPDSVKVPHMGWNNLSILKPKHPLLKGIPNQSRVYFVHSFYGDAEKQDIVIATSEYGRVFPAAVGTENVMATQFHPEKSGETGLQILKNFVTISKTGKTRKE